MRRLTLADVAASRLPLALGLCATDVAGIAAKVNEAQERLILAAGETGFNGGWEPVVFRVEQNDPYITLPPEIARIINMDICRTPVNILNEWYQFLIGSRGLIKPDCDNGFHNCNPAQAVDKGSYPTAYDIPDGSNSLLRLYVADFRDVGVEIFFSDAKDQNGYGIYTDGNGFQLACVSPFATTSFVVSSFVGIQKPETYGDIVLKAVDATTGTETFLARYTPDESNPSFRRYLLTGLPKACCDSTDCTVQVTAMAKLEYIPVRRLTDFLLIQSIPALINECQAIRMEGMDSPTAATMALNYHNTAMKLANQQLGHQQGKQNPSITVSPFGSATLARQGIGRLV